jgi:hypothetical protein
MAPRPHLDEGSRHDPDIPLAPKGQPRRARRRDGPRPQPRRRTHARRSGQCSTDGGIEYCAVYNYQLGRFYGTVTNNNDAELTSAMIKLTDQKTWYEDFHGSLKPKGKPGAIWIVHKDIRPGWLCMFFYPDAGAPWTPFGECKDFRK